MSAPKTDDAPQSKDFMAQTSQAVDEGFKSVSQGIGRTAAATHSTASQSYAGVVDVLDHAEEYVGWGRSALRALGDTAVAGVKGAVAYSAANPYAAYSGAAATALLVIPGTRRMLWRITLGRLTSVETVIKRNEAKVESLKSRITDYSAQVQKLEERLLAGEEELNRGYQKLKGTRNELQRLANTVSSSQATAAGIVRELRLLKKVDGSLALRGEAAAQAAALKSHLARINKGVYRIANKDI